MLTNSNIENALKNMNSYDLREIGLRLVALSESGNTKIIDMTCPSSIWNLRALLNQELGYRDPLNTL